MAVRLETSTPNKLLSSFKKAIDDGLVATWSYDHDGDFTHTAQQWKYTAWFRPEVGNDELVFYILKPKNKNISTEVYAIFHGRLVESMLAHFDKLFINAVATAMPSDDDNVT